MLRIAVISLLVANLLLLGFQGSKPVAQPEVVAKQTVVEDTSTPTIHLFSEMIQNQDLMSGNRRCFSLGPFHSLEDKNEIRALLDEGSANISERETQALVEKGYWVYMPPYKSLLEANQVLLSLQALGLKDIGVIYDDEWKNAISLGYFLRQENALRRKKDLEDRNFAPRIRVKRQPESRYWLDYEQNPGSVLIAIDMQYRPNDFMRRSLPCPDQNPFENTANVAQNLAVETKQPQMQVPEEESQTSPEENNEPPSEEISELQLTEGDDSPLDDGERSQPIEPIDPDPEDSIDAAPPENDEVVPESASEAESKKSVGTGPVISFGAGSEDGDETGLEDSDATEPEDGDETGTDGG